MMGEEPMTRRIPDGKVGSRIAARCRERGFYVEDLAKKVGVSNATMAGVLAGEIRGMTLVWIAKELKVSIDWLLFGALVVPEAVTFPPELIDLATERGWLFGYTLAVLHSHTSRIDPPPATLNKQGWIEHEAKVGVELREMFP